MFRTLFCSAIVFFPLQRRVFFFRNLRTVVLPVNVTLGEQFQIEEANIQTA